MVHLHCRVRTRVRTGIQIPNLIATLYYVSHVHITQTRTRTPTPYLCTGQESESVFSNVNEPLTDGQQIDKSLWWDGNQKSCITIWNQPITFFVTVPCGSNTTREVYPNQPITLTHDYHDNQDCIWTYRTPSNQPVCDVLMTRNSKGTL